MIEDISCFGKCSFLISLPILSKAGVEVVFLPTAIFAVHSGIGADVTCINFAQEMKLIIDCWEKYNIHFDAVFVGYSYSQTQIMQIIDLLKKYMEIIVLVDPVMEDDGNTYNLLENNYIYSLETLCKYADYITPNITEAMFLAQKSYHNPPYTEEEITEILHILEKNLCVMLL